MKRYDQVPHTADLAARIYGNTIPEIFENSAFAMFDMMAGFAGPIREEDIEIAVEGPDLESLLIFWLNELLYRSCSGGLILREFHVTSLGDRRLTAVVRGGPPDGPAGPEKEIKAATFHDLAITEKDGKFEVTVVFDV